MKNYIYDINIDNVLVCYEIYNQYFFDKLTTLPIGERYDLYDCYLLRVEGKDFENVFQIWYDELGEDLLFGELRFGINKEDDESNTHTSDKRKAWISIDNRVLYGGDFYYLDFISLLLNLEYDNITLMDLCLDITMDIAKYLKQLMMRKDLDVIINGKKVKDKAQLTQEISYIYSNSLNKNKDLTLNIKNSRDCSLMAYNKKDEIENSSSQKHITDLYGNPKRLFRLGIHLNRDELNDYLTNTKTEFNLCSLYNKKILFSIFFHALEGIIRFERNGKRIDWWDILDRKITSGKKEEKKNSKTAN